MIRRILRRSKISDSIPDGNANRKIGRVVAVVISETNQEVLFSKVAQQVGHFDNPWLIFSKYIDAVNENCTQSVLPKWETKLGGAREFMSIHCFAMSEAERVDPTLQAQTQNSTFIYK